MAAFRPIPPRVLVHTATHTKQVVDDVWESPVPTETELRRVRVYGNSNLTYQLDGAQYECNLTLIFDCTNSRPEGHEFAEGDTIEWNSQVYTIKAITRCYTVEGDGMHHWELGLV